MTKTGGNAHTRAVGRLRCPPWYRAGHCLSDLQPDLLKPWLINKGEHSAATALLFSPIRSTTVSGITITPTVGSPIHLPWRIVLPKAAAGMESAEPLYPPRWVQRDGTLANRIGACRRSHRNLRPLAEQNANDFDFTVGDCTSLGLKPGCNLSAG